MKSHLGNFTACFRSPFHSYYSGLIGPITKLLFEHDPLTTLEQLAQDSMWRSRYLLLRLETTLVRGGAPLFHTSASTGLCGHAATDMWTRLHVQWSYFTSWYGVVVGKVQLMVTFVEFFCCEFLDDLTLSWVGFLPKPYVNFVQEVKYKRLERRTKKIIETIRVIVLQFPPYEQRRLCRKKNYTVWHSHNCFKRCSNEKMNHTMLVIPLWIVETFKYNQWRF